MLISIEGDNEQWGNTTFLFTFVSLLFFSPSEHCWWFYSLGQHCEIQKLLFLCSQSRL